MSEFNLKSGNATPFKMMGSSPAKQAIGGDAGEAVSHWDKYKSANSSGKQVTKTLGKIAQHPVTKTLGKALSWAAIPLALHDFYKSGQKHSDGKVNPNQKSFMANAKKNTTSIFNKSKKPKGSSSHDFDDTLPK